jgi:hypothetical protein
MTLRSLASVALALALSLSGRIAAEAQEPRCLFYRVAPSILNVAKEPGEDVFIDLLEQDEVVCVTRARGIGARDFAFIPYKIGKPTGRQAVEGWADFPSLRQLSAAESAAAQAAAATVAPPLPIPGPAAVAPPPAAPPAPPVPATPAPASPAPAQQQAAAPPEEAIIRFSEPIPFGPYPVNGRSIEQLITGVPLFPPIEGLDESIWKKNCGTCHKWDRTSLCEQGGTYLKNPRFALRQPHPYGGPDKVALMRWAKTGCQ